MHAGGGVPPDGALTPAGVAGAKPAIVAPLMEFAVSDVIEAFPSFLNKHIDLRVDEQPVQVRLVSSEWNDFWRPFLTKFAVVCRQYPRRLMVAVAGAPGTGKSLFAAQLSWILNQNVISGTAGLALAQDGFHHDGHYLKSHFRNLPTGEQICLADVKGAVDTFDVAALKQRVEQIRAGTTDVGWPAYNRTSHEIIANRHRVPQRITVVVIEGSCLLLDAGPYAGLPQLFDLKIFLDTPGAKIISGLMARHMANGKSMDEAKAWIKKVDLPNAQLIMESKSRADVLIRRNDDEELESFTWRAAPAAG